MLLINNFKSFLHEFIKMMTSLFWSNRRKTRLTCGFKVNTNSPQWHKSMTKILKKIRGGNFWIDVDEGMAYVTGQGDPNKLLKLMGSKRGKYAEMAFVKTGSHHQDHSNFCQNSYFGAQTAPYMSCYPQGQGYYPQAMQPYHHQYPYAAGYHNYGYY